MSLGRWLGLLGVCAFACTPPPSGNPCNDDTECTEQICSGGFCVDGTREEPPPLDDAGEPPKVVDAGALIDAGIANVDAGVANVDAGPEPVPWLDNRWGARVLVEVLEPDFPEGAPDIAVPVPVRLAALPGRTGDLSRALRVTDDDGVSELAFELESVLADPNTGDAGPSAEEVVWVNGNFADGRARFYLYFDNPDASPVNRAGGVWEDAFTGVFHLENDKSSARPFDLGEENNVDRPADFQVGAGLAFDGTEDYVQFRRITGVAGGTGATVCLWLNRAVAINSGLVNFSTAGNSDSRFGFESRTDGLRTLVRPTDVDSVILQSATVLEENRWYHACAVADLPAGRLEIYLDGVRIDERDDVPVAETFPEGASLVAAIAAQDNGGSDYFDGVLDEVQVSNVARSARHIKLTHAVQLGGTTSFVASETQPRQNLANVAPIVDDDNGALDEDDAAFFTVLDNDIDDDGHPLSVISVSGADNGVAFVAGDNTIFYEPDRNFFGDDSLTCEISDGFGGVISQSLEINVASVNDRPSVNNVSFDVDVDATRNFSLQISDPDDNAFQINVSGNPRGSVSILQSGNVRYVAPSTPGDDDFQIRVSDDDGATDTANIFVDVLAIPPPVDGGP